MLTSFCNNLCRFCTSLLTNLAGLGTGFLQELFVVVFQLGSFCLCSLGALKSTFDRITTFDVGFLHCRNDEFDDDEHEDEEPDRSNHDFPNIWDKRVGLFLCLGGRHDHHAIDHFKPSFKCSFLTYVVGSFPTVDGALGSDNECEDQAQNGESFSQRETKQCNWLQLRLGFWLACHTVDVCGENQTHTNGGANRG